MQQCRYGAKRQEDKCTTKLKKESEIDKQSSKEYRQTNRQQTNERQRQQQRWEREITTK